jgi:uncharacterized protein YndB with AHSA1/START domain
MRWVVWIVAGLAVVGLVVAVVGALLPKAHTASRTARIAMPPDVLYTLLSDVDRFPSWRRDLKRLERRPDRDGKPAWIEETGGGMKVPMVFERMERPSLLVGRIDSDDLAFGGTWTYRIAPAPGASDLTITEEGEVHNVIFRFMSKFVFGHYATMDVYLEHLQAKAAVK